MKNYFNCIYMYTNKINGKRYVGQTVNFNKRHNQHITSSYNEKTKYDYNVPFHNAIRKYGIDNFEIKILAENIPTQEKMNEYEKFFIRRYNTLVKNDKGYNITDGGSNGSPYAGKTEEEIENIRRKISENHANVKKENHPQWGTHRSEETKKKQSEKMKGKRVGKNHPMYGKHLSEETKKKLSEANKGKKQSEESKQKRLETLNNRTEEEKKETIRKMLNTWNNKTEEEKREIRRKQGESLKGKNTGKKIIQLNKETKEIIKIWDYASQASEELNIDVSSIIKCCRGKIKSYKGFVWKYYEED